MKAIIGMVLSQEEKVSEMVSVYLDNIYVDKDIVSPLHVRTKLAQGLEWLEDGAHELCLDIHGEQGIMQWTHETVVPELPDVLTRRPVFSLCGRVVGHLLVCGWLCVVASTIKHWVSSAIKDWDDETTDPLLARMMMERTLQKWNRMTPHQMKLVCTRKQNECLGWC